MAPTRVAVAPAVALALASTSVAPGPTPNAGEGQCMQSMQVGYRIDHHAVRRLNERENDGYCLRVPE